MSKYHPLDVRHPANRNLERRNFLLDPPRADLTKPPRPRIERSSPGRTTTPPPATPTTPWGRARAAAGAATAGTRSALPTRATGQQSSGRWRLVFLLIVVLTMLYNAGALDAIGDTLTDLLGQAERIVR